MWHSASRQNLHPRQRQAPNEESQIARVMLRNGTSNAQEQRKMKPKNTICLWFDREAQEAARFYAATFPNSEVTAVHEAPGDYRGQEGRCADRGVHRSGHSVSRYQRRLGVQAQRGLFLPDRDGQSRGDGSQRVSAMAVRRARCGWCSSWGLSWQITRAR